MTLFDKIDNYQHTINKLKKTVDEDKKYIKQLEQALIILIDLDDNEPKE